MGLKNRIHLPKTDVKRLTVFIIIGLISGFVLGLFIKQLPGGYFKDELIINGLLKIVGTGFINLIKMTVIPLVFASLAGAISSMDDLSHLKKIGGSTIFLYLITTAIAATIAIILGLIFKPGSTVDMSSLISNDYTVHQPASFSQTILNMIPENPIKSLTEGNMLQIIIFALLLGLAVKLVGKKAKPIGDILIGLNDCMLKLVWMVMKLAPFGIAALIATTVTQTGFDALVGVAGMILVSALGMLIQAIVIYGIMIKFLARLPFLKFLKAYLPIAGITFSTSSSNASLPLSMDTMRKLGVKRQVYTFTLPLGATINMNGTAIMQAVAVVFIAQIYHIHLSFATLATVVFTAVLASVGTAGTPGVGMIMLAMVLQSANLPLEGIALIMGFDRILDMMRTTINVMGDCVCTLVVAKFDKQFDKEVFDGTKEPEPEYV